MLEKCKIKSLFISTLDDDTESPKCKPEMTSQTSESQSSGESQEMQEEHETPTLQVKKRFRFMKMRQNHSTLGNDMFNNWQTQSWKSIQIQFALKLNLHFITFRRQ